MKKRMISALLVVALCISCFLNAQYVEAKKKVTIKEALNTYEKDIIASARKTGVWASVTAAQFCLESGNPISKLASEDNNFFGIKWSKSHAKKYPGAKPVKYTTREYSSKIIKANFTHFPTVQDGITEHAIIWWNGAYKPELKILYNLKTSRDDFLKEMANGPYATDPNYLSLCRSMIKKYNLDRLDKLAYPDGRKYCGYNGKYVGEYNYPDDGYNEGDVKAVASKETQENGSVNLVVKECDLIGMPEQSQLMEGQSEIELPDSTSLSTRDYYGVQDLKNSININSSQNTIDTLRILVVFLGMFLIFYSVFLFLAMLFDRANQFIEISLVGVLTLGKLRYSDDEYARESYGLVNTQGLIKVAVVILLIGFFLVSGGLFTYISRVSLLLNKLIGG